MKYNAKYYVDPLIAIMISFLISPLILIIAFLIFTLDGRPIFFVQNRIGKNKKIFNLYKFRTMRQIRDAELGRFDMKNRYRVTKLGGYLRKSKVDEIPQLLNILKGDMTFVGPRPEVGKWTKVYPEKWDKVLSIKPGLTDPASIRFRNEEELLDKSEDPEKFYETEILPAKLAAYQNYIDNASFLGDLNLVLKTIKVVILK